jgi:hypothetical protein
VDVPVRILEPRRSEVAHDVDVSLARRSGEVVVLEGDTLRLQLLDHAVDVVADSPGHGRRLVRARVLGDVHE